MGLGNLLMGDEGIGIHVVRDLQLLPGVRENIALFEAGTSPISAIHMIANRGKAVLIDCAYMGLSSGEIRRFSPEEVLSLKSMTGLSLHEGDLLNWLEVSRRLGEYPNELVVLGIEPAETAFGEQISPELEERIGEYVDAVLEEIGVGSRITSV